jgi:hypothetical protein
MAHNNGPFAAARRQIASREAAPAAEPADALTQRSEEFPSPQPSCCRRTIFMPNLPGISTFRLCSVGAGAHAYSQSSVPIATTRARQDFSLAFSPTVEKAWLAQRGASTSGSWVRWEPESLSH